MASIPVTVVTGFLGSGKTTLLAGLLRRPGLGETAVIVNELGEIAIDHHLLRRVDERTVLLANGCLCCSLRGDLTDELRDLLDRRASGEVPRFRRVLVETTGLADPAPILTTLISEPSLRHHFRPEAVIATVDAVHGLRQLERQPESLRQAAAADCLVITKADLAERAGVRELTRRLAALNPGAAILEAEHGNVDPRRLFRAGQPRRLPEPAPGSPHTGDVRTCSLVLDRPLDWTAFGIWLTMLLQSRGADVLRVKGLLDVGGPGPVVLDSVQHVVHPPRHLDSWPDGDRRSRLVLIGRGLDAAALETSLAAFDRASTRG